MKKTNTNDYFQYIRKGDDILRDGDTIQEGDILTYESFVGFSLSQSVAWRRFTHLQVDTPNDPAYRKLFEGHGVLYSRCRYNI